VIFKKKIIKTMTLKEMSIREYISHIDFKRDDWKLSKIKEDMRKFLGEEPGIDIIYGADTFVDEDLGEAKVIKTLEKISIVFYDTDDKFKKLEFLVGNV
jgi:hypothetical protein